MLNIIVEHVENGFDAVAFKATVAAYPGGLSKKAVGLVASWYHAHGADPHCATVFTADRGPRYKNSGVWSGPSKTAVAIAHGSIDGQHGTWHLERAPNACSAPYMCSES